MSLKAFSTPARRFADYAATRRCIIFREESLMLHNAYIGRELTLARRAQARKIAAWVQPIELGELKTGMMGETDHRFGHLRRCPCRGARSPSCQSVSSSSDAYCSAESPWPSCAQSSA